MRESNEVDNYIKKFPEKIQKKLLLIRETIQSIAIDAEEVINYKIPCYKYNGNLVSFAGFKDHLSFFPMNGKTVEKMKDELKNYKTSTGTIQFRLDKDLPLELIKKIVRIRIQENNELKEKKSNKK